MRPEARRERPVDGNGHGDVHYFMVFYNRGLTALCHNDMTRDRTRAVGDFSGIEEVMCVACIDAVLLMTGEQTVMDWRSQPT